MGAGRGHLTRPLLAVGARLIAHLGAGRAVDVPVTLAMALACAAGALAGAAVSGRIPQRALGRAFATLVLAVAGGVLVSAITGAY